MFNNYDFPYTEQFKQEVAESVKKSAKKRRGYFVPVRTGRKIGRNEKCPCGSGKKYKRCCGGE